MIALGLYRADLHDCGHPLAETTAADAESRYIAGPPHRCHACTALSMKQDEYKDAKHASALLYTVERR